MAVLRPRNRIVSFRLSQEAFDKLNTLCAAPEGPRSLSELSRSAVEALLTSQDDSAGKRKVQDVLARVDQTTAELKQKVDELFQVLQSSNGVRETPDGEPRTLRMQAAAAGAFGDFGKKFLALAAAAIMAGAPAWAQAPPEASSQQTAAPPSLTPQDTDKLRLSYMLGPNDQVLIRVPQAEELNGKTFRVDAEGNLYLPVAGTVRAGGITVQQLELELTRVLSGYYRSPAVRVMVIQYRSDPVFFVGAFRNPGIYPLQGNRTLLEMLTIAGGLQANAGRRLRITRRLESGSIPLAAAVDDRDRNTSVAEVSITRLMETVSPEEDLTLKPYDVVHAGTQEMVYVSGEVGKVGGIPLTDRDSLSVLQALSLSGGLGQNAAPQKARVLRPIMDTNRRAEIPVNVKAILNGSAHDLPLGPNDILVIPRTGGRRSALNRYFLLSIPPLVTSLIVLGIR